MLALKTILHPTDFSPRAEHAFHLACALARDHGSRLIVLHVQGAGRNNCRRIWDAAPCAWADPGGTAS